MPKKTENVKMVKVVKLEQRTFDRLAEFGKFGESIDDVVNRIVDIAEKQRNGE